MLRILITIETNPHWEPLNNFDKVAAGIFRRQKAEQCSRGAREILDRPLVVATERINMNFHSLTRAHIFELSFLEVRRHPDIVKGNDGKQTLSWLNPLAEFDGFASNDTADGRIDLRIAKIQFRDAYIRLRLIHLAHAGIRFGSGIAQLLWRATCSHNLSRSLGDQTAALGNSVLFGGDCCAVGLCL